MEDHRVMSKIDELAREEHELFEKESSGKASDADRARLKHLQVTLDQCWDLLRQRCPGVPDDLWRVRRDICIAFIGRAAADRARRLDRGGEGEVLSDDRFVDNLLDMVTGAMTAPHVDG